MPMVCVPVNVTFMPAGCRARTPSAEFTALQLQFIPFLRLACTPLATVCSGQGLGEAKNNHFTSYYSLLWM
jgi:hypothetical protein